MKEIIYIEMDLSNIIERKATSEDVALGFAESIGDLLILDAKTGELLG